MKTQKLILPLNNMRVTAGYKNKNYEKEFPSLGRHYGVDCTSTNNSRIVYASGQGTVKTAGWDDLFGFVVAINYDNVELRSGKVVENVTIRYFHLHSIKVKVNQLVTKDTVIATYGTTGRYSTAPHLHFELDVFDGRYYAYSPSTSKSSRIILKGIDSTINPTDCLFVKRSKPDNQFVVRSGYNTVSEDDINYPILD